VMLSALWFATTAELVLIIHEMVLIIHHLAVRRATNPVLAQRMCNLARGLCNRVMTGSAI
jgi:hypothetical protein